MRLFLVLVVLATPSAASAAGAWLTGTDSDLQSTDAVRGLALGADGRGYAVTWDGAGNARIHEVVHTLTSGPQLAAPQAVSTSYAPTLAYDGATAVVGGDFGGDVLTGQFGSQLTGLSTNVQLQPVVAVAIDRSGSHRALVALANGGVLDNASRTADIATPLSPYNINTPAVSVTAVAVWQNLGVAMGSDSLYAIDDVDTGGFTLYTGLPAGVAANPLVAANAFGGFLIVGTDGAAVSLANIAAVPITCSSGTVEFSALTALEGDFWLGRANGTVERVNASGGCPWSVLDPSQATGLLRVDGLAVVETHQALALGPGPGGLTVAWRNRPPLTPSVTGGGAIDDETASSATVTPNDPDLIALSDDPPTFAWTCDPLLAATGTTTDTIAVTTPILCVDADVPGARTDLKCAVTTTDSDSQESPSAEVTFSVLPIDAASPAVVGVNGLADGAAVLTGTLLTLTADASDDCLHQATWTVRDQATGTVREQRAPDDWNLPFAFVAATLGSDEVTSYTLELTVTDTAGNVGALAPFTFMVALPQPPVEVDLTCPATLEAGALGTATAAPRSGSGTVLDYTWMLGGAATTADATPTDATFTFQTDACDGGDRALLRMVPHGIFEDGAQRSCAIDLLDPASPAPPALVVAEAPVLPIALGEDGFAASLQPSVTACASHDVTVRWDLSGLPAALRPPGTDDAGELALGRTASLALAAGPEQFASLEGTEAMVRAVAVDARTGLSSTPVEVTLRFFADAAFIAAAGVDVRLVAIGAGAVDDGELVSVRGTITTDVAPALPGLTVALAGDGLAPVPGSLVIDSDCGARATVAQQGDRAVLTLEGVSAGCPAAIQLVARRGFGGGGLIAQDCAFGATQTPLSRCQGGLTLDAPAALSCAAGATPPLGVLALVLCLATRRASTCARRQG